MHDRQPSPSADCSQPLATDDRVNRVRYQIMEAERGIDQKGMAEQ